MPQNALATMKLVMLLASPHQAVVAPNMTREKIYSIRRPKVSDSRPYSGWKVVEVSIKAVDSHDAEFEEWK
jgi:hypothetical protein